MLQLSIYNSNSLRVIDRRFDVEKNFSLCIFRFLRAPQRLIEFVQMKSSMVFIEEIGA